MNNRDGSCGFPRMATVSIQRHDRVRAMRMSHIRDSRRRGRLLQGYASARRGGSMGMTWRWAIVFVAFCALGTSALQHDSHQFVGETSARDRAWSALHTSMEQMHRAMASVEASGNSDVDF